MQAGRHRFGWWSPARPAVDKPAPTVAFDHIADGPRPQVLGTREAVGSPRRNGPDAHHRGDLVLVLTFTGPGVFGPSGTTPKMAARETGHL